MFAFQIPTVFEYGTYPVFRSLLYLRRKHLNLFFFSLSADGRVVAISYKSNVYFYSGLSGALLYKIESVHTDHITAMVSKGHS